MSKYLDKVLAISTIIIFIIYAQNNIDSIFQGLRFNYGYIEVVFYMPIIFFLSVKINNKYIKNIQNYGYLLINNSKQKRYWVRHVEKELLVTAIMYSGMIWLLNLFIVQQVTFSYILALILFIIAMYIIMVVQVILEYIMGSSAMLVIIGIMAACITLSPLVAANNGIKWYLALPNLAFYVSSNLRDTLEIDDIWFICAGIIMMVICDVVFNYYFKRKDIL